MYREVLLANIGKKKLQFVAGLALMLLAGLVSHADAGPPISFGIQFGGPPRHYHHHHGPGPWGYYYRPYYRPLIVAPRPAVIIEPAPIVIQKPVVVTSPEPVYTTSSPAVTIPDPTPLPAPQIQSGTAVNPLSVASSPAASSPGTTRTAVDVYLQRLGNPDENTRLDAVLQLGRLRAESAVEPLTASLAGDSSPQVRATAARSLALIGSPRALTALQFAGRADSSADVRSNAQFAVEVINTRPR